MEAAVNQLLFCPPRQMIWNKGLGEGGDGGKGVGGGWRGLPWPTATNEEKLARFRMCQQMKLFRICQRK